MTVSSGGVILVGKVQCMHNGLIICGPVVDTGCSVVCTGMALVGGNGGYMQHCGTGVDPGFLDRGFKLAEGGSICAV